jgi:hypothetical protein
MVAMTFSSGLAVSKVATCSASTMKLSARPFLSGPRAIGSRISVPGQVPFRGAVAAKATEDVDFDKVLADLADKFEKSDNKTAIIGYSAAAAGALWFSEWLIHLPLFNVLLGFPIQLLGLVLLPYFGVKYLVDKDSALEDAKGAVDKVTKKLPGFD